jgi:Mitochondrial ATPase expression
MRGSGPCLGALSSYAHQTSSRIPHLKLHILARQSRRNSESLPKPSSLVQQRCVHAAAPFYGLSGFFSRHHQETDQIQQKDTAVNAFSNENSIKSLEHETLESILGEAHPERVLYTLLCTIEGKRFVQRAEPESFASAFCSIDPWHLLEPLKNVYRDMKPSLATQPKYRWVRAIEERLETLSEQLKEIVRSRRSAGHRLTKDVCSHLLHCARVLGDGAMARDIWQVMMPEEGLASVLDLRAYNCFTEAICWSHAFSKAEQWSFRVVPPTQSIRNSGNPPLQFSGHQVGRLGLRHESLVTFRRMVGQNIEGDEETFTNLMIAMGREGDLSGAKSILKSVYNIDVDLLLEVDEEEVETPTFYESDSPLRPSPRLLYTIAHVFGSNNEISLALKLVDFVSRQYDLRIPFSVWMHLLDWAFVLSLWRTGVDQRRGWARGRVLPAIMDTLWREMTDEPHNIKPDVVMHIRRARSYRDRGLLRESLKHIHSANDLFNQTYGEAERLGNDLLAFSDQIIQHTSATPSQILPAAWFDLRHSFVLSSFLEDRDLQMIMVEIRLMLQEERWPEHGGRKGWERRRLPDLIAEFTGYLPNTLVYRTRGGTIEIAGLKQVRIDAKKTEIGMSRRNGLLRSHFDGNLATILDLKAAVQGYRAAMEEIEELNRRHARRKKPPLQIGAE